MHRLTQNDLISCLSEFKMDHFLGDRSILKGFFMSMTPTVDDYFRLIGRVAVNVSLLEVSLKQSIGTMNCTDEGANVRVTAGMSFLDLATLFRSLFLYRVADPSLRKRCQKLIVRCESINIGRNTYIHSEWFLGTFQGDTIARRIKIAKKHKSGLKMDTGDSDFAKLESFLTEIAEVSNDLALLVKDSLPTIIKHRSQSVMTTFVTFNQDGTSIS